MLSFMLAASIAIGADPVAISNARAAFAMAEPATVFAKRCSLCDSCECVVCLCPAAKKAERPVSVKAAKPAVIFFHPNGHTHTCANDKCPFNETGWRYSWGGKDHGHACPYCSVEQTVQDAYGSRVITVLANPDDIPKASKTTKTVTRTVQVPNAPVPQARTQTRAGWSSTSAVVVSGGCVNGNCSPVTFRR